jgi:hypothetical protein
VATARGWGSGCARWRDRLEEAVVGTARAFYHRVLRTLSTAQLASRYAPHAFAALLILLALLTLGT